MLNALLSLHRHVPNLTFHSQLSTDQGIWRMQDLQKNVDVVPCSRRAM